jgi:hypothetical protein
MFVPRREKRVDGRADDEDIPSDIRRPEPCVEPPIDHRDALDVSLFLIELIKLVARDGIGGSTSPSRNVRSIVGGLSLPPIRSALAVLKRVNKKVEGLNSP